MILILIKNQGTKLSLCVRVSLSFLSDCVTLYMVLANTCARLAGPKGSEVEKTPDKGVPRSPIVVHSCGKRFEPQSGMQRHLLF